MYEVQIRVIKTEFYPDIAEKYLIAGETAGACPVHEAGDVFIYKGDNEKPEGLCATAWLDICRAVTAISNLKRCFVSYMEQQGRADDRMLWRRSASCCV